MVGTQALYYTRRLRHSQEAVAKKAGRFGAFLFANIVFSRVIAGFATESALQSAQERNIQEEVLFSRMMKLGATNSQGLNQLHSYHRERYVNKRMDLGQSAYLQDLKGALETPGEASKPE